MGKVHLGLGSSTYDNGVSGSDEIVDGYFSFSFGLAKVIDLNDKNMVVLGVTPIGFDSFSYEHGDIESSSTFLTLPAFNIGFESQICKWLMLRSGFEQTYYCISSNYDNGYSETESSFYDNSFAYNMGLSIMFSKICIVYAGIPLFFHFGNILIY